MDSVNVYILNELLKEIKMIRERLDSNILNEVKEVNQQENDLLTIDEMMNFLGVGKNKAYEICRSKEFPTIKIGKSIRINKRSLIDWLENKSKEDKSYLRLAK
jgi:excisionase family DNA binding protein